MGMKSEKNNQLTLWQLAPKRVATISRFDSNLQNKSLERLNDLGFRLGEEISCLQNNFMGGPSVYKIGDSVFSLAKEIAESITINEE